MLNACPAPALLSKRWIACGIFSLALLCLVALLYTSDVQASQVLSDTAQLITDKITDKVPQSKPAVLAGESGHSAIPAKIWQILFPAQNVVTEQQVSLTTRWMLHAPDYTYTLLGSQGGHDLVKAHYGAGSEELKVYDTLRHPAIKSDLLRYLVLAAEGGHYGDVDTHPVVPLPEWVPSEMRPRVRLLCAPEHDVGLNPDPKHEIPHPLQFGQWTITAAPGHPVLRRMVKQALTRLHDLARLQGTTLDAIAPSNDQVLNATGPWPWTDVLWDYMREVEPSLHELTDLSRLTQPRLVGDVLVLPVAAFRGPVGGEIEFFQAVGQTRLVEHEMLGTWRQWQSAAPT